jgi:hypothetical protein
VSQRIVEKVQIALQYAAQVPVVVYSNAIELRSMSVDDVTSEFPQNIKDRKCRIRNEVGSFRKLANFDETKVAFTAIAAFAAAADALISVAHLKAAIHSLVSVCDRATEQAKLCDNRSKGLVIALGSMPDVGIELHIVGLNLRRDYQDHLAKGTKVQAMRTVNSDKDGEYEAGTILGPSKTKAGHWAVRFGSDAKVVAKSLHEIRISTELHSSLKYRVAPTVRYESGQLLRVFRDQSWQFAEVQRTPGRTPAMGSQHLIRLDDNTSIEFDLNETNHAPALLKTDELKREQTKYKIDFTDTNSKIYDIFSDNRLDIMAQTAGLSYEHGGNAGGRAATADVNQIVRDVLSDKGPRGVLIKGKAASGKSTVLKKFTMGVLKEGFSKYVPILIPVVELIPHFKSNDKSNSIITYFQHKYKNNAGLCRLMMQSLTERSALLMIDGMDECGGARTQIEDFIKSELLEKGHRVIITSRPTGINTKIYGQCQIVNLQPLNFEQQTEMVRSRIPNALAAQKLLNVLHGPSYGDIASNPLTLTMAVSIALKDGTNYALPQNRAELYSIAITNIIARRDQLRKGISEGISQVEHLLRGIALCSHKRTARQFKVFTEHEASEWVESAGEWIALKAKIDQDRLPLIASVGKMPDDTQTYCFSHLSFQVCT